MEELEEGDSSEGEEADTDREAVIAAIAALRERKGKI